MQRTRMLLVTIVSTLLILSIFACVYESKQGELSADCAPTTFSLYGEIDPTWGANVVAGEVYQLNVEAEETAYPLNQLKVEIYSIQEDGRTLIAEARGVDTEEQLSIIFTGPNSERILIKLIAQIGADGDDLGEFSVELCRE